MLTSSVALLTVSCSSSDLVMALSRSCINITILFFRKSSVLVIVTPNWKIGTKSIMIKQCNFTIYIVSKFIQLLIAGISYRLIFCILNNEWKLIKILCQQVKVVNFDGSAQMYQFLISLSCHRRINMFDKYRSIARRISMKNPRKEIKLIFATVRQSLMILATKTWLANFNHLVWADWKNTDTRFKKTHVKNT